MQNYSTNIDPVPCKRKGKKECVDIKTSFNGHTCSSNCSDAFIDFCHDEIGFLCVSSEDWGMQTKHILAQPAAVSKQATN